MYTLLKPINVRQELLNRKLHLFTPQDFMRIFKVSPRSVKYFLETQVHDGFLIRLKQGLYGLKADLPTEEEIANALYKPSYLSFEYALAYYGMIPEMPYTITSATTKPTRLFTISDKAFSYRTIKKEAFNGYTFTQKDHSSFFIADKEKALIDYLYFVTLRKSPTIERLLDNLKNRDYFRIKDIKKNKIQAYAQLFGNKRLIDFMKKIV